MTARSLIALLAVATLVLAVASSPSTVAGPGTVGNTGAVVLDSFSSAEVSAAGVIRLQIDVVGKTVQDFDQPTQDAAAITLASGLSNVKLPGTNTDAFQDPIPAPTAVVDVNKKFTTLDVRLIYDLVLTNPTQGAAALTALGTAINAGAFPGLQIRSVTQLPAPGSPAAVAATTTTTGAPAVAPAGGVTSGNIDITIHGTRAAFTTTEQNALTVAVANAISGTAAIVNIVETTVNARKFTVQASALRVTVAVTAPAAQYPTLATIVARLQTVARQNQGRLGNSSIISITISGAASAARSGPIAMTFLMALLVAVLSAVAQF